MTADDAGGTFGGYVNWSWKGGSTMETLADLASRAAAWRFELNESGEVEFMRRSTKGSHVVGPLATLELQKIVDEDEDGTPMFDLSSENGLILYAVAALPQLAELVVWADEELAEVETLDKGDGFLNELRRRVRWLRVVVDARHATVQPGVYGVGVYYEWQERSK